jgi:hypothetical protein
MNEYSNKIQPVQPVEKIHMSIYSYPVFNQEKRKRKQSESSISFRELLDRELRKQERCEEVAQPAPVTVKPTLCYNVMDLLNLEK